VRGDDDRTGKVFSDVDLEARVRRDHPLRAIRTIANEALAALEREFAGLYSPIGQPSIPRRSCCGRCCCRRFTRSGSSLSANAERIQGC
jgi:hypothetical protein